MKQGQRRSIRKRTRVRQHKILDNSNALSVRVVKRARAKRLVTSRSTIRTARSSQSSKKQITKPTPLLTTQTLSHSRVVGSRRMLQLMRSVPRALVMLAPARFPSLHVDQVRSMVRVTGIAIIGIGGLLTLFNFYVHPTENTSRVTQLNVRHYAHWALTMMGIPPTNSTCESASGLQNDPLCQSQNDRTIPLPPTNVPPPIPTFSINAPSPLRGVVTVHVTIYGANQVVLAAYHEQERKLVPLGAMRKLTSEIWSYDWDTRLILDGNYTLHAVIYHTSIPGGYEHRGTQQYTVENIVPISEPQITSTGISYPHASTAPTTTPYKSSAIEEVSNQNATVSMSVSENGAGLTITVSAPHGAEVKIYASKDPNAPPVFSGYAWRNTETLWRYDLPTAHLLPGTYSVMAIVRMSDNSVQTVSRTFTRNAQSPNAPVSTTTSSIATSSTKVHATELNGHTIVPAITLSIPNRSELSGMTDVTIFVTGASFVELYAQPARSLKRLFLGLATPHTAGEWRFRWDTRNIPNGSYVIFANVSHQYGFSLSNEIAVVVHNPPQSMPTINETERFLKLKETGQSVALPTTTATRINAPLNILPSLPPAIPDTQSSLPELKTQSDRTMLQKLLETHERETYPFLLRYAHARRDANTDEAEQIRKTLLLAVNTTVRESAQQFSESGIADAIHEYFTERTKATLAYVDWSERVLRERLGNELFVDSDNDGISDYDEITLYHTDPLLADTDGDGYSDEIEIQQGYDPRSPHAEAAIVYELPFNVGIERPDILLVQSISAITPNVTESTTEPLALIVGRGLPHSFVTLYIFSTPIIVTVRTTHDGSWSYILDQRLEDGEHVVYAAMTDNAGRIIAKSTPFSFIKSAEAFMPKDVHGRTPVSTVPEPVFLSSSTLLTIASIIVIAFGLLILLLGYHLSDRRTRAINTSMP